MTITPDLELAVYRAVCGPIEDLEWSATARGQGHGPHGSGDGAPYPACPSCGGLKDPTSEFIPSAIGHQPGCKLASLLGKKTRELNPGEQAKMAL